MKLLSILVAGFFCSLLGLRGATLTVGPGKRFTSPCAAIGHATPGDTIEIDAAGKYAGDVCSWKLDGLTLKGVNGRPRLDAAGHISQGKAIWVIAGNDTVVENIEFTGATAPDKNGAGIRQEGRNLTVRNCYFHENEDGILAGSSPDSKILIEYSEFAHNGAGDGYSHNLYINHVARFTFRFCYSHGSVEGHLLKTRAAENFILYNRLSDEAQGTGSYEINVPNGGLTYVIGNIVEQGPRTANPVIMTYLDEGVNPANPGNRLYVVNNTFVNDRPGGGMFISIATSAPSPAVIRNNIFWGPGTVTNQARAILAGNLATQAAIFVDAAAYDFHLRPGAPAIGSGVAAGDAPGFSLAPVFQYMHPACGEPRIPATKLDIGAYGFASAAAGDPPPCR